MCHIPPIHITSSLYWVLPASERRPGSCSLLQWADKPSICPTSWSVGATGVREEQKKTWISPYFNVSVSVEGVCVCCVPVGVRQQPVRRGWSPARRPWRIEKRRRCVGSSRSQKTWGRWTWPARTPLAAGKKDYQPAERGRGVSPCSVCTHHSSSLQLCQLVWGAYGWRPGMPWSYQSRYVLPHTHCGLFWCRPWTHTPVWPEQPGREGHPIWTLRAVTLGSDRQDKERMD